MGKKLNEWSEIPLENRTGKFFKVDKEYEKEFKKHKWMGYRSGGKLAYFKTKNGIKWRDIMTDFIDIRVTYKNDDTLDLTTENLVVKNRAKTDYNYVYKNHKNSISPYHGSIVIKGVRYKTAHYDNPIEVAKEIDKFITTYNGDLTKLNFPIDLDNPELKKFPCKITVYDEALEGGEKTYDLGLHDSLNAAIFIHSQVNKIIKDLKKGNENE